MYMFAYGSLMNRSSAESVLQRPLAEKDLVAATLEGYRRCWRVKEELFFDSLNRRAMGVFLDLCQRRDTWVNGVLIHITDTELSRLKKREKNYHCINVASAVHPFQGEAPVMTFISKPEYQVKDGEPGLYIPQRYIDMVRSGCLTMGSVFLKNYEETTEPTDFPIISGRYHFIDFQQAQYV